MEKKEGNVISKLRKEDGTVTEDPREIDKELAKTIEEIQIDPTWGFLEEKAFPRLPVMKAEELQEIVRNLATAKAGTFDGLSDIMFKDQFLERTAEIFADLWSIPLESIPGISASLTSRLVPLNKAFPDVPARTQMRPILICSPLQKLLEARFLPKLNSFLLRGIFKGQVGFVKGMGTSNNLFRAVSKIRMMTRNGKTCFGLFIDFANAFNTVPHLKLFERLRNRKCLAEDEISFLEALFARLRIRVGNSFIRVNKGVPQGSLLSPALFDIFIDDLAEELMKLGTLPEDSIFMFADDVLILCDSFAQVAAVIRRVEEWGKTNGMSLNKKKSGIVPFANRMAREKDTACLKREIDHQTGRKKWSVAVEAIEGVPVLMEMKWLGTVLDFKLSCNPSIARIKRRTEWLFIKLFPFLSNASADGRRDMWQTLVVPHFLPLAVMFSAETSKTKLLRMFTLWEGTFKKFLMLPKNTKSEWIEKLMAHSFGDFVLKHAKSAHLKHRQRFWNEETPTEESISTPDNDNFLIGVPNAFCQIIKDQMKGCPACSSNEKFVRASGEHLEDKHGLEIITVEMMIDDIKDFFWRKKEKMEKEKKNGKGVLARMRRADFAKWKELLPRVLEHNREILRKLTLD